MGKKSVKENKNIYQLARESAELTRAQAEDQMEYVTANRIEKIESGKSLPHPEEILAMAKAYKTPGLCNSYCSQECPIGQKYVPTVEVKELSQIILEMVNSINMINTQKDRLVSIAVDGKITDDEYADFAKIENELEKISLTIETLQFWIETTVEHGDIDLDKLSLARKQARGEHVEYS